MKRDLNKLSNTEYDVLVVGAGIYGVASAWDAALRGLKVALIDKADFGGATSSNSLKIIHGGLRYLQQLDFKRMRESIHERMVLMRIAPHLIYPMPVIMPTYAKKLKSRPAMFMALIANDIVGFDRNRLKDPHKYMPNGRIISIPEVRKHIPDYEKYNMSGGAVWYDCQCYNTERLLLAFIHSAVSKGADAANYVQAVRFKKNGTRVTGVQARDILTGDNFEIRAKQIVNNSGPWVDTLLNGLSNGQPRFNLSTAMNIVINRQLLSKHAAGLSGPYEYKHQDGSVYKAFRMLFFAPWRKYTIIGTNHLVYSGQQDEYKVTEAEIQDFLGVVNQAYSAAHIKREEVSFFYGGFLPMAGQNPQTGEVMLLKHYDIIDHKATDNVEGLLSVIGVKYTTARDVAKKTIDLVFNKLNRKSPPCQTEITPLYGGEIERFEDFVNYLIATKPDGLDEKIMRHLAYNYGSMYQDILKYVDEDVQWLQKLPGTDEALRAEVLHAVREEMAQKLADVILRRTDIGSGELPADDCLTAVAQIMAQELNWDERRMKQEIEETKNIYTPAA